jgi:hypothetical protein
MDRLPAQGHPALMASVSPTLGPFLLNEFSIVVNIDQPRVVGWASLRRPNRQLSATLRSAMLLPNTGEARALIPAILDRD